MPSGEEVLEAIRQLELELEQQFAAKQEEWKYRIELGRARFDQAVLEQHRRMRTRIGRYLRESSVPAIITAPVIYSLTIPFALIDAWVTVYQWICFPVYEIPKVRRSKFIAIDRHNLAYLNGIEKANCEFCSYANGVIAYVREVAARTEQVPGARSSTPARCAGRTPATVCSPTTATRGGITSS